MWEWVLEKIKNDNIPEIVFKRNNAMKVFVNTTVDFATQVATVNGLNKYLKTKLNKKQH